MKSILLTSTALVMVAGIAAADGHSNIKWSGSVSAGLAREGNANVKAVPTAQTALSIADANVAATKAQYATLALYKTYVFDVAVLDLATAAYGNVTAGATIVTMTQAIAVDEAAMVSAELLLAGTTRATLVTANNIIRANQLKALRTLGEANGYPAVAAGVTGEFQTYSEANATLTGDITVRGMTVSAGVSLDAGNGYDFANDDGFDNSSATYTAGRVSLDTVSLDMGTAGKITFNDNAITHLVDGDDDGTGDVSYSNTFGAASVNLVMDVNTKDTDDAFVAGTAATLVSTTGGNAVAAAGEVVYTAATKSTAQDVQWSAKVSMPIGGGTVYGALDEEGGNAFGGSAVMSGMTLSLDSALEAMDKELKVSRSNTLKVAYAMGAMGVNFSYNTIKDGDQWGIGASYKSGDMSVAVSTDEGSDWSATGTYALGTGASVNAGINYTEDAYLGLTFAF